MIPDGERHKKLIAYAGRLLKNRNDFNEAEILFRERWLLCEQPDGQIPEAKFHTPTCPYPSHMGRGARQAGRRIQPLSARAEAQEGQEGQSGEGGPTATGRQHLLRQDIAGRPVAPR